jgi:hypothetical protein
MLEEVLAMHPESSRQREELRATREEDLAMQTRSGPMRVMRKPSK